MQSPTEWDNKSAALPAHIRMHTCLSCFSAHVPINIYFVLHLTRESVRAIVRSTTTATCKCTARGILLCTLCLPSNYSDIDVWEYICTGVSGIAVPGQANCGPGQNGRN